MQLVETSKYRTWETESNSENYYGQVLTDKGVPIICGHGGSMWLCKECGLKIVEPTSQPKELG